MQQPARLHVPCLEYPNPNLAEHRQSANKCKPALVHICAKQTLGTLEDSSSLSGCATAATTPRCTAPHCIKPHQISLHKLQKRGMRT